MKEKAFTLIELLAVIVILAIIALIATPIILGIIKDARENSKKRSAELVYTGVEYAYTQSLFKEGSENVVDDVTLETIDKYLNIENISTHKVNGDTLEVETKDNLHCEITKDGATKIFSIKCINNSNDEVYLNKIVQGSGYLDALTDLTNTKWKFNEHITDYEFMSEYGYTDDGMGFDAIRYLNSVLSSGDYSYEISTLYNYKISDNDSLSFIYPATDEFLNKYNPYDGMAFLPDNDLGLDSGWYWGNPFNISASIKIDPPVIEIHDGDLVTDEELINWFKKNATFIGFLDE